MQKNVASQKLIVFAFDSTTNLPKTGDAANITAYVSKDYGSVTVLGDTSATEMDATNAKGYYLFDVTQTETNADTLLFSAKSSTSNIVVIGCPACVFTTPPNFSLESIDGNGRLDVIKLAGTTQTARDIGASVLLSTGTGTGQLDFTSGVVKANATQWVGGTIPAVNVTGVPLVDAKYLLGTIFPTPTVAGIPNVNVKTWNDLATVSLPLIPTVAGRTLDVSTGGEAGLDWANVGSPTTSLALTGTTIAVTQKVDVDTIKTNPVVNAGTITFPTGATLASTTNITAGTIATVTTLTNLPSIPANWLTAAGIASAALNGKGDWLLSSSYSAPPSVASIVTAAWTDLLASSDFSTVGSVGKLLKDDIDAAVSSRSTYAGGDTSGTTTLLSRVPGTVQPQTGDSYARLGAPAGASIAADLAEIEGETDTLLAGVTVTTNNDKTGYALTASYDFAKGTVAMTESYNADGAAPTPAQALFVTMQTLTEKAISGTTVTVKKLDGVTTALTLTLDSSTAPTSATRAS